MKQITSGTTKQFLQDINDNFKELSDLITNISFGTSLPSEEIGEEGDIYIQYE